MQVIGQEMGGGIIGQLFADGKYQLLEKLVIDLSQGGFYVGEHCDDVEIFDLHQWDEALDDSEEDVVTVRGPCHGEVDEVALQV
jgi:hypothetical protein